MAFMRPCLPLVLLLGPSCGGPSPSDTGPVDNSFQAQAQVDPEVSLVLAVTWTTRVPGTSWVEFQDGRSTAHRVDTSTEHRFLLHGLPPLTSVPWRAVTEVDGVQWTSEGVTSTGEAPSDLPPFQVTWWDPERTSPEAFLVGTWTGGQGYAVAFDRSGQPAWYLSPGTVGASPWTILESYASTPEPEQVLVGTWTYDPSAGSSTLYRVDVGGDVVEQWDAGLGHHSILEVQGVGGPSTYWLVSHHLPWVDPATGTEWIVTGDDVMERTPDGAIRTFFSTFSWQDPVPDATWGTDPSRPVDWTHANSLFHDPATNTVLLSLRNLSLVLELDRDTGQVLRTFGTGGDYPFQEGSTPFLLQHHARWTDAGTLTLTSLDEAGCILAIEYQVDEANRRLGETWSYGKDLGLLGDAGGEVWRLSNGNTLFNAGTGRVIREVTPEGEAVWEATWEEEGRFYKLEPTNGP